MDDNRGLDYRLKRVTGIGKDRDVVLERLISGFVSFRSNSLAVQS